MKKKTINGLLAVTLAVSMAVAGCSAPGTSGTETAESAGEEKGSSDAEETDIAEPADSTESGGSGTQGTEAAETAETGAYDVAQLEVVDPDGKASTISGFM